MAIQLFIPWIWTQMQPQREPKNHAFLIRYIQYNALTIFVLTIIIIMDTLHLAALSLLVTILHEVSLLPFYSASSTVACKKEISIILQ